MDTFSVSINLGQKQETKSPKTPDKNLPACQIISVNQQNRYMLFKPKLVLKKHFCTALNIRTKPKDDKILSTIQIRINIYKSFPPTKNISKQNKNVNYSQLNAVSPNASVRSHRRSSSGGDSVSDGGDLLRAALQHPLQPHPVAPAGYEATPRVQRGGGVPAHRGPLQRVRA